ncbi:hypothetical protein FKR81_30735 [Lentzea tibetensis]|uniref:Uncharacterized protein n=1 Tax=Lentzea tibetensis TaxID=2591470 RepID=A0A563ELH8_9PSEU|nr:hypothetical protein [Lentzea tibetensis]TWP47726.1 hypothetical protein FKR81_30735 [Lentzea tibetensis]
MGWYTSGPDGLRYRSGDVFAVAAASGLGTLWVTPWVGAVDADGEPVEIEGLMLLGDVQQGVERAGLPWERVELDGDRMRVPLDVDVADLLDELSYQLSSYSRSVRRVLADAVRRPLEVAELSVRIEAEWGVPPEGYPDLEAWLDEPSEQDRPRDLAAAGLAHALRSGEELLLHMPSDVLEVVAWNRDEDDD